MPFVSTNSRIPSRWKSEFGLRQSDLGRLVEMMIQFKSMGELDLDGFEDLRDSVEKVGLAKLTELMSEVRDTSLISSASFPNSKNPRTKIVNIPGSVNWGNWRGFQGSHCIQL